jgi:hypothetical protein
MALNRITFILDDALISRLDAHHHHNSAPSETINDSVTELLESALDYIASDLTGAPVPDTVFAPSKLPIPDTTLALIAELAASTGNDFDTCLRSVVAEGINHFHKLQGGPEEGTEFLSRAPISELEGRN